MSDCFHLPWFRHEFTFLCLLPEWTTDLDGGSTCPKSASPAPSVPSVWTVGLMPLSLGSPAEEACRERCSLALGLSHVGVQGRLQAVSPSPSDLVPCVDAKQMIMQVRAHRPMYT